MDRETEKRDFKQAARARIHAAIQSKGRLLGPDINIVINEIVEEFAFELFDLRERVQSLENRAKWVR